MVNTRAVLTDYDGSALLARDETGAPKPLEWRNILVNYFARVSEKLPASERLSLHEIGLRLYQAESVELSRSDAEQIRKVVMAEYSDLAPLVLGRILEILDGDEGFGLDAPEN